VKWKDSSGAIWIFGGVAGSDDEFSWRNDLWKFDPSSGTWTWMSGTPNIKSGGVCGTRGVPSVNNVPGGRVLATSWIDSSDNLWLMGGWAYDCGGNQMIGNDLWKYSPSTNQWAWMGGSNTDAVYGSKGVPSSNNIPAARQQGMAWTDPAGNFWLFGGFGHNGTFAYPVNGYGAYSDFWRYQPSSGQWTWMGGSQTGDAAGNYGTLGTPSPSNMPGARRSGGAVVDNQGNLWLFGGMGAHDSSGNTGGLNDLWKYQPSTGVWTWVSGSNGLNAPSTFGTQGVAGSGNAPGLRTSASYWADGNGQIWVFGGEPFASSHSGILNDLWVFNPNTAAVASNPISQPTQTPTTPIQSQPVTSANPAKVICRFPVGDAQWNECINYAPRGSIIFPQYVTDGHDTLITPGLQPAAGLAAHVQTAANAGMKVLGYVNAKYTDGTVKSDSDAKTEIDIWFQMPGIRGIYFGAGGALDQASINHFNMLADYIHSKGGIAVIHGDEGNGTDSGYTDQQLISHFDVMVTAESYSHYQNGVLMNDFFNVPVFNDTARAWMSAYPRSKFAAFANLTPLTTGDLSQLKQAEQDFLNYGDGYLFLVNVETGPSTNYQAEDLNYWKTFVDGLDGSFDGNLPQ
jgi:N-acetylneuraminic acid mutarotase